MPVSSGAVSQTILSVGLKLALFAIVYVALLAAQDITTSILEGVIEREV